MKDNKKFNLTVAASILLSLAFLAGWWLIFSSIRSKSYDLKKIQSDLSVAAKRSERIRTLEKTMRDWEEKNEKIKGAFVTSREIVKVIEGLEDIASKTNAAIKIENVAAPEGGSPSFQFSVSGEFSDLFQYLTLLENMPYEIAIAEARMQKSAGEVSAKDKKYPWEGKFKIKLLSYEAF